MKEFELEPNETVVREARKHWLLFAAQLTPFALLALLPPLLPAFLRTSPQLAPYAESLAHAGPLLRTTIGIWLLVVWTAAWSAFTRYFLNLWVLTSQRIVEVEQRAFFNREVSSLLLNRVQDVKSTVRGLLPSLLHIGTITVQSAGTEKEFCMTGIPEPEEMRDLILKYVPEETPRDGI